MKRKIIGTISIIIGLYLIIISGRSIISLSGAGKKIDEAEEKLARAKKQNEDLKNKLREVKSPQFVEKIARDQLNMSKTGESLLILPSLAPIQSHAEAKNEALPNWKKWYNLFF